MAKLLLILVILFLAGSVIALLWEKVVHPFFFSEEMEDVLESAAEEKIRKETNKLANEIMGGDDAAKQ